MSLTRKHFEAVAASIKKEVDRIKSKEINPEKFTNEATYALQSMQEVANHVAVSFGKENERFNRTKFMEACGF